MGCCMPCLKDARGDRPVEPPSRSVETTSLMSWVADDDELAATCYKCSTEFDAYVHRRHHCRRCGNGARASARASAPARCPSPSHTALRRARRALSSKSSATRARR